MAKLLTAAAVASLATAPVIAAPASPATKLSLSRASTVGHKKSEIVPAVLIGVLATVAIVGGAVALSSKKNKPSSP
ncbi:MAG: hypothetical protein WDN44_15235 [Sphingomonas sp.]